MDFEVSSSHRSSSAVEISHFDVGPLVVYDPKDPQAHLYDVDDGKLRCISCFSVF